MLDFKTNQTENKEDVSIGLKEQIVNGKREWRWIADNSQIDYTNWAKGWPKKANANDEPRCGTFVSDLSNYKLNGQWKHVSCDSIQANAVCTQVPYFNFSDEALKAMRMIMVRKKMNRKLIRGDRHSRV